MQSEKKDLIIDDKFLEWLGEQAKKEGKEFYCWKLTRWDKKDEKGR